MRHGGSLRSGFLSLSSDGMKIVLPFLHFLAFGCPTLCLRAEEFTAVKEVDRLVIARGGRPLAHFVFNDQQIRRPYFAHVKTLSGVQVTRAHPPVEGADPVDHAAMHPGIWLAF